MAPSVPSREFENRKPSDTPSDLSGLSNLSGVTPIETRTTSITAISSYPDVPLSESVKDKPSLIKRRFTSSWARKRRDKDEGVHGPTGLQLLYSSPEPLIDLIFVHGLRGGSVKTWRKGPDPRYFWPQCWLPIEPGFGNTNIHSFGYDSDWASLNTSILNVHDFGQCLLQEMRNSPHLRDKPDHPIILIGHSMGGIVIKKAFILAQELPAFKNRIRCICFLATPHRGSDYAATLNRILTVSGVMSSRHYISDITTGSSSVQLVNDDFGRYAQDLPIFSFYETQKMSIGISSFMIVEKNSAVLGHGYRNERVQYVDANHRDICKFDSIEDPNYVSVKNALASAVEDLLKDSAITKYEESFEKMKSLRSYLGISDSPDEQFPKVDGSCTWIEARDDFQDWRDCAEDFLAEQDINLANKELSIFWVHANPGTGKTVLASHVVSQLQDFKLQCSYYYFHTGDKNSRSLGPFLRSIALQMAASNSAIREKLFRLRQEGVNFDLDDTRTIWTKVFRKAILPAQIYNPQYWVIDALDECTKYQELFTMLRGEKPNFPLRIFMTSRNVPDMQRLERSIASSASLTCIEIPVEASLGDIGCYIHSRIDHLPIDSDVERAELANEILQKSNACFLWVRLVLDELENVYSSESIIKVLERIPKGMIPYYERTVKAMAANTLEKHISKAVLVWTVASIRKLTIQELSQALELDIKAILPSARSAVEGLCGQLVFVDKDSGLVDLIHPTAREFLLSEAAGEFMVSKSAAHQRIALTCLKLLSSAELRSPRNRRFLAQPRPKPSPFLDYALTQFTEHVYIAPSETDEVLIAMDRFFKTNSLSWIERLALNGRLHDLIRASKNLKAYLDRRAKYRSPLNSQVRTIDGWSIDLSRMVTQFGEALLDDPSSIYFLIPPLCPSTSAIHQQFGKRPDGISVVGPKSAAWDDCIAYVSFREDIAAAVSCGENLIAVGMESGDVNLYNHRSCQREGVIHHQNPVDLIHLADNLVASCTTKAIILQDLEGNKIWESRLRFRCLLLTSWDNCIVAVSQHGHLLKWDKVSGVLLEDQKFDYQNYEVDTEHNGLAARPPHIASISPDMEMLALGYRGGAVCLWETHDAELIGWARDDEGRLASKVLFNPNPNINLLLVIYTNHDLALYDTWSASLVHSHITPNNVGLLSASCSPDGRTLVTTDSHGNMHIWDFESLRVLYHVLSPFPSFRILNFTSDGSSVVDCMDSGMRIWSPAVLVRKNVEEDGSTSDDAIQLAVTEGEYESRKNAKITALCAHPVLPVAFAGKYNGQVIAFNTKAENSTTVLYSHSQTAFITKLAISEDYTIASSDVTGVVQVRKLAPSGLKCEKLLVELQTTAQVKQICFSANGEYLLVATIKSDCVYRVNDGARVGQLEFEAHERKVWRWLILPHQEKDEQCFSLIKNGTVRSYEAKSFPSPVEESSFELQYALQNNDIETDLNTAIINISTQTLVLEVRHDSSFVSSSTMFLFDISNILSSNGPSTRILAPIRTALTDCCKHFVGFGEASGSFIFVHRNSWLSSITLAGVKENEYCQHFFVPNDFLSSGAEVFPMQTAEGDILFCLHGELIAVKNGLKFQEMKDLG